MSTRMTIEEVVTAIMHNDLDFRTDFAKALIAFNTEVATDMWSADSPVPTVNDVCRTEALEDAMNLFVQEVVLQVSRLRDNNKVGLHLSIRGNVYITE